MVSLERNRSRTLAARRRYVVSSFTMTFGLLPTYQLVTLASNACPVVAPDRDGGTVDPASLATERHRQEVEDIR